MCTNFNAVAEKAAFGEPKGMAEIAKHLLKELNTQYLNACTSSKLH